MKKKGKIDKNQPEIVTDLRKVGVTVTPLSQLGKGVPDLLCGIFGFNILIEVKSDKGKLTEDQVTYIKSWNGEVFVCYNTDECIEAICNYIIEQGRITYHPLTIMFKEVYNRYKLDKEKENANISTLTQSLILT